MPPTFRPTALGGREVARRRTDRERGSAHERGYDRRWSNASKVNLADNPLCAYCLLNEDRSSAATLTDHLYPHRVYDGVFWESKWWVSSCDACHNGFKQAVERRGKAALDDLARRLGRETL